MLLLNDLPNGYIYQAIHNIFKLYRIAFRIWMVYDIKNISNRCDVTFSSSVEAKSASEAVGTHFLFFVPKPKRELLWSRNVTETCNAYVSRDFEEALKKKR